MEFAGRMASRFLCTFAPAFYWGDTVRHVRAYFEPGLRSIPRAAAIFRAASGVASEGESSGTVEFGLKSSGPDSVVGMWAAYLV